MLFVKCSNCGENVLKIEPITEVISKVSALSNYGGAVGSLHFCKECFDLIEEVEVTEVTPEELVEEFYEQEKTEEKEIMEKKSANEKYNDLALHGMQDMCSKAMLYLRKKSGCDFSDVASLYNQVHEDLDSHSKEMIDRLLGKGTPDREYYRSWSGE